MGSIKKTIFYYESYIYDKHNKGHNKFDSWAAVLGKIGNT